MPQNLKPYFWDVNFEQLNILKDKDFIVTRLLEMGRLECAQWLFNSYDRNTILEIVNTGHNLKQATCNMVKALLN